MTPKLLSAPPNDRVHPGTLRPRRPRLRRSSLLAALSLLVLLTIVATSPAGAETRADATPGSSIASSAPASPATSPASTSTRAASTTDAAAAAATSPANPSDDAHLTVAPDLDAILRLENGRTYKTMLIILQVAVILVVAKLMGWLAERIKVPGVIGELLAGALIGPYLLGAHIPVPLHGHWVPLFPPPTDAGQWPVNDTLWTLAQFASVILLFIAGLHTDLKQFLRYMGPASVVALVGLVAPFTLGAAVVYIPAFAELARPGPGESVLVPALFVGAILAATSIGITARVLGDIQQLETPEGVTILGAAVLDDVLGIIALAVVGGIAAAGSVSAGEIGVIAGKAFGFWIGLTVVVLLLAKQIERALTSIKYGGAVVALGLALALLASGAAEGFGLAFIIGAYSVGLGLSRTQLAHRLMDELKPIADFLVPVFFAVLGMLVNFGAMFADWRVVVFGLAVTVAAVVGKLVACGGAALLTGFNRDGAYRVGLGMMPRGEVALIVAGVGLSRQLVGANVFGVSILMTLITTIVAPILLVRAFANGRSGRRVAEADAPGDARYPSPSLLPGFSLHVEPDLAPLLIDRLVKIARERGWATTFDQAGEDVYVLRNDADACQVSLKDGRMIRVDGSDRRQPEFEVFLEAARRSIIADVTHAEMTKAAEPVVA